jgi:hypothetical protein
VTRTCQTRVDAIIDLEAIPACLAKAEGDATLLAPNQTHRRPPAAFEAVRGLAEPIDLT